MSTINLLLILGALVVAAYYLGYGRSLQMAKPLGVFATSIHCPSTTECVRRYGVEYRLSCCWLSG